jgi:hypothetical protein
MDVTVVSVVGGPDVGLIPHWLAHYRALGVEHFVVAVNDPDRASEYDRYLVEGGVTPVFHSEELFSMDEMPVRYRLDAAATTDWLIAADLDEFIVFDRPLNELIEDCQAAGYQTVRGYFIDHIQSEGHLVAIQPSPSLWQQFPLMHPITRYVRGGCDIKAVLRHRSVPVTIGNHLSDDNFLSGCHPIWQEVHHFRWTNTTASSLRLRIETMPNYLWRREFENVLEFLGDPPRLDLDRLRELAPFIEPMETFPRMTS